MEGWLLKKMPRPADRDKRNRVKRLVANALRGGDQFQRRYVVLDGAAGELAYYRDDDDARRGAGAAAGLVDLRRVLSVDVGDAPGELALATAERLYAFRADSAAAAAAWAAAVRVAAAAVAGEEPRPDRSSAAAPVRSPSVLVDGDDDRGGDRKRSTVSVLGWLGGAGRGDDRDDVAAASSGALAAFRRGGDGAVADAYCGGGPVAALSFFAERGLDSVPFFRHLQELGFDGDLERLFSRCAVASYADGDVVAREASAGAALRRFGAPPAVYCVLAGALERRRVVHGEARLVEQLEEGAWCGDVEAGALRGCYAASVVAAGPGVTLLEVPWAAVARVLEAAAGARARRTRGLLADTLRAADLFRGFGDGEVAAMVDLLELRFYGPGDVVVAEGDKADGFYVILCGAADVATRAAGPVRGCLPGDWFGEIGLLKHRPRAATVSAGEDGGLAVLRCDAADFGAFLELGGDRLRADFDAAIANQMAHLLAPVPQFAALGGAWLGALAELFDFREVPRGGELCAQGAPSGGLFVVLRGFIDLRSASVAVGGGGAVAFPAPATLATLRAHDLGGFSSLVYANAREPFTAAAAEDALVLWAAADRAHALLRKCPMLRHELEVAADALARAVDRDVAVAAAVHAAGAAARGALEARVADLEAEVARLRGA